eukprot:CAMPEP_0116013960 /NCGR_PEP_ID=MMETSP0321-20121206/6016_1 /TAXON_ID=163516 /ORGANISM="Leptocylindrus danicus var. danicus, Strain B650" /LENGTH=581 /DNA_ID=CAMNT_0003483567 /DNA_START=216 /DNA_END=1961 /DNA_ORIENTATION=+
MTQTEPPVRKKRSRWDTAPADDESQHHAKQAKLDPQAAAKAAKLAKARALKDRIKAQLANLKRGSAATAVPITTSIPAVAVSTPGSVAPVLKVEKRAKVYDIDLKLKPDISEIRTAKANIAAKKKVNPYLSTAESNAEEEVLLDGRLDKVQKLRRSHRPLTFVEPGVYIKKGERKREKQENAKKAGFVSGRKEGTFVKSAGIADINVNDAPVISETQNLALVPRADVSLGNMPIAVEWYDMEFLPNKLRKQIASAESASFMAAHQNKLKMRSGSSSTEQQENLLRNVEKFSSIEHCKTFQLVQHPVPVKPLYALDPAAQKPKVATLHLTKKELKRQRKLRRAEKQRDLQDQQALGLIPPPEPRLTMANFMQVLGDQAVIDPSKIEAVVAEKVAARRLKHEQMNLERKLTPKERAEKRRSKFAQEDTSKGVSCALFCVKDMSHPYHRAKVDLNAQQWSLSGGVVEVSNDLSLVIVEGGVRGIKKFVRLMTVRTKWIGMGGDVDDANEISSDEEMEDEEEKVTHKFNPNNYCELVWQGINPKRLFNGFLFQMCSSTVAARKVLEAKGVAHFWDQVEQYARDNA